MILRTLLTAGVAACTFQAAAQATVAYTSPAWKDFGTTNITGVAGNFLPGWTTLNATPDIGNNLFAIPTTSLSGAADDAALWMNHYDPASLGGVSNETVRLSLSGFSIGQTYELIFSATLVRHTFAGWTGDSDSLDVAIIGADISDWDSTVLSDPGDADGLNTWASQTLTFVAQSTIVEFDFGENASAPDIAGGTTRLGIDSVDARLVPAPASALALIGLSRIRRRRC